MTVPKLSENEDERLKVLASYDILDSLPQKDFDEITQMASEICNTPISLISFIDGERQWFKSRHGIDIAETDKELAFCAHAILKPDEVFVVPDASKDERFADNPLTVGKPNVIFYTGVPLVNGEGHALGTLCVIDNQPKELTQKQITALKSLANQVMAQLELRKKLRELNEITLELQKSNEYLERFAMMASHDIKSPLTSIMLTGQLLKTKYGENLDQKGNQMLDIVNSSARRLLSFLNQMLHYSQSYKVLSEEKDVVYLNELIAEAVKLVSVPENFEIEMPRSNPQINTSAIAMEQIFVNLLTNAVRYNDKPYGSVSFEFTENADFYHFRVSDNGIGIDQENFEKVFEPMTTLNLKDRYNKSGSGIGLSTVKNLVEGLGGEIHIESVIAKGATFVFTIKK